MVMQKWLPETTCRVCDRQGALLRGHQGTVKTPQRNDEDLVSHTQHLYICYFNTDHLDANDTVPVKLAPGKWLPWPSLLFTTPLGALSMSPDP